MNISQTARDLGIPRQTLQSRIRKGWRPFEAERAIPRKDRSLDELLRHRREESKRARDYESARACIRVKIHTPGPVGLLVFGDPHIDSPGCDFELLERHLSLAAERPDYVFAGNIGDVRDNWIGRLTRLYSDTTVSSREGWRLTEWMFRDAGVNWQWLVRGNHDMWSGDNDPLDWIARGAIEVDQPHGIRIAFEHPNGSETRLHARHDFPGHSQFNPLHALKKEVLQAYRDHILVAGHRHEGADARDHIAGLTFCMVRLSGYKVSDSFADQIGAHKRPLHPSALIVIDPDEPDSSSSRVWVAPSPEVGCFVLDQLRSRYDASRPVSRKAR